jgi:hypothetical protein
MDTAKPGLSDRSVLIMTPPQGVLWIRLPTTRETPLTKKDLRHHRASRIQGIDRAVTWRPILAAVGVEGAAVLYLNAAVREIAAKQRPLKENLGELQTLWTLSNKLFSTREHNLATGPHGIRHIRQAMYWIEIGKAIRAGYNLTRGFYVDDHHNQKLEPAARYRLRSRDGLVLGFWPDMPPTLVVEPPGRDPTPSLLDRAVPTGPLN